MRDTMKQRVARATDLTNKYNQIKDEYSDASLAAHRVCTDVSLAPAAF